MRFVSIIGGFLVLGCLICFAFIVLIIYEIFTYLFCYRWGEGRVAKDEFGVGFIQGKNKGEPGEDQA